MPRIGWAGDQNLAIRDRSFLVIAARDSGFDVVRNCPVAVIKLRIQRARARPVVSVYRAEEMRADDADRARDMFVRVAANIANANTRMRNTERVSGIGEAPIALNLSAPIDCDDKRDESRSANR